MKKIFALAILYMIISVPVLAEPVYTNSSLRKYNAYKSQTKIKKDVSNNTTTSTTTTNHKTENQEEIIIANQNMSWANTKSDGINENYSWQVELTSTFKVNKQIDIEFNLLDKEGAILNVAKGNGNIDTNETETFSGTGIIKSELATQAVRTSVKLTVK